MNVRLIKCWHWQSGLVYKDDFYINSYTARIHMHTTSMYDQDHDVAYGRMEYWFQEVMQDSVMLSAHASVAKAYSATGQRVLFFPDQPVDQLVGIMLCLKLNAICEGRLIVTEVELQSEHGANMTYLHHQSEAIGPFAAAGWWNDSRPCWSQHSSTGRGSKVVSLARSPEWNALDLEWNGSTGTNQTSVLFADFNRDDDQ